MCAQTEPTDQLIAKIQLNNWPSSNQYDSNFESVQNIHVRISMYINKTATVQVSEQLKQASLAVSADTLAQMREASRGRVEKREREEASRVQEIQRRREFLKSVFTKWKSSDSTIDTLEVI